MARAWPRLRSVALAAEHVGAPAGPGAAVSQIAGNTDLPRETDAEVEAGEGEGMEAGALTTAGMSLEREPATRKRRRTVMDRLDSFISRLSTRSHFWQRIISFIWMPYSFKSGIRMKRLDERTFSAVLPFRRFNRNWYNAMAGAALLGNAEIAGGMYVFDHCAGDWTVVCKQLEYKFLRPCFGPAVYKITPRESLDELVAAGSEFNITLDMEIVQQSLIPERVRPTAEAMLPKGVGGKLAGKEKRVGRCTATFHVTRKAHQQSKGRRVR